MWIFFEGSVLIHGRDIERQGYLKVSFQKNKWDWIQTVTKKISSVSKLLFVICCLSLFFCVLLGNFYYYYPYNVM